MTRRQLLTKNGYDFYEIASLLQKSLRRNDIVLAARAANELLPFYANYVWNRLMTVSAEDCADIITVEIVALHDAWEHVNKGKTPKGKGRVFIAKAIVILARARHSRDADVLNILASDRLPDEQFRDAIVEARNELSQIHDEHFTIPDYVYDVHTFKGKRAGATKQQFLWDEEEALTEPDTVFDNLRAMIRSHGWIDPSINLD